jgi:gamma-glutamyltranspeptidase/glutathione hydrolase
VETFGSGRLTLADILQPAIDMAERGFPVSPIAAYHWAKGVGQLRNGYRSCPWRDTAVQSLTNR